MKIRSVLTTLLLLPVALFGATSAKNCGCECCKGKEVCCCQPEAKATDAAPAPKLYPLTGKVVDVMTERQALLVKHEEIPGVMRAMTMLLRVDPPVLTQVKKGDAIKALLGRDADNKWFLRDVQVTTPAK
jgi:Cu/Ag efflux protein CusF